MFYRGDLHSYPVARVGHSINIEESAVSNFSGLGIRLVGQNSLIKQDICPQKTKMDIKKFQTLEPKYFLETVPSPFFSAGKTTSILVSPEDGRVFSTIIKGHICSN